MSATFQEAAERASWWARYALDRAPDETLHPGVVPHLTAACTQLVAVEGLCPRTEPKC